MNREEDKRKNYSVNVWYREKARLSRRFHILKALAAISRLDGSANGTLYGIGTEKGNEEDNKEGVDK